ncbi:beta-glucosidase [Kibdelosporangium banguiense]|uniref:Beta-glucosidase n=1 Tax=Kibdelosporangium banguiense TaxID=1365924 RepID=A0ABS4TU10_9PSEU|nr:glycoside hydrolase family 3 C-terminal domain-containing protein [Kibdelosporangium banguiense]MBP2327865.1 beta-glucosidase [Kibdelosporangium banguiense]
MTDVRPLLARLTLEEKVALLTGRDFWTTWPNEKIGLRRMLLSDGPAGVRGEVWDERDPSASFPSGSALSSSWDCEIARRYGAAVAVEARRKGVDVVLGPTINLHRSPLGGRHFEAFSEDPLLTGELGAAFVEGSQANGIAATPKHYVANDSETDRFTVDVRVSDRALREVYLAPFEKTVVQAHAWLVMSAYNSINGATATENDLLETPLNDEWGFDGVVISDWTAVRSIASARASQDLVMPGPDGPWGAALVAAVRDGSVPEAAVDRKVIRILQLAARVGALAGFEPEVTLPEAEDPVAFAREAAAAGTVLLTNRGELPWIPAELPSLAVIGHNAAVARIQGGGSATVVPETVVSPLDGLRAALPNTDITYAPGVIVHSGVLPLPLSRMVNPHTGEPGVRVAFADAAGAELYTEDRRASDLLWFGGSAPIADSATLILETHFTPETSGEFPLAFAALGTARLLADGEEVLAATTEAEGADLGAALLSPPSLSAPITVTAGTSVHLRAEFDLRDRTGLLARSLAFTLGTTPPQIDPQVLIDEAVQAARAATAAVIVVGTNSNVESEGHDRTSLSLPGFQDDLVRAVAAANPRTVVVVNAGSPVLLPWRDEVAAVLVGYFGGQESGNAVADILTGAAEPGGRLPTTWPVGQEDVPVLDTVPVDGNLEYSEGIHVGYRAWLSAGTQPAFPFGHGLGYTTFRFDSIKAPEEVVASEEPFGGTITVSVGVTNTGPRSGKHVVQVYAARPDSAVDRPVRWLAGFQPVWLEPGSSTVVDVEVDVRTFAHWDKGWHYEPGSFTLSAGSSAVDLPLEATIRTGN